MLHKIEQANQQIALKSAQFALQLYQLHYYCDISRSLLSASFKILIFPCFLELFTIM